MLVVTEENKIVRHRVLAKGLINRGQLHGFDMISVIFLWIKEFLVPTCTVLCQVLCSADKGTSRMYARKVVVSAGK